MNLSLIRKSKGPEGIFSELHDEQGKLVAVCLEHAYKLGDDWEPKIYTGSFVCKRGQHQLEGMTHPFTTFEITGVVGHTNILFHTGNSNADSAGCVLLGKEREGNIIVSSRITFNAFMDLQKDVDHFNLTVS